jgi:CubicO group peptidase (beta-lactamase class C family)
MAKFGLLMLNKGNWNGTAIMKDSNYFKQMTNSSQTINKGYGYLTWLNGKTSYMAPQSQLVFPGSISPDAPNDVIMALGKNGQLINVCPSKGLVWIRMGNAPSNNGSVPWIFNNEIWKYINQLPCAKNGDLDLESEKLGLFPNVAKSGEMVLLQTKSKDVPQIFNSLWQSMKVEGEFNAEGYLINTQNMPSGIYLVKIKNGQTIRMVLQ